MKNENKVISIEAGDVVIHYLNHFPVDFLHIASVEPMEKGWWKVTIVKLGLPSFSWFWNLSDDHLAQNEWTFNGIPNRLQIFSRANFKKETNKIISNNKGSIPEENSDDNEL